ncbi:MAG: uncharacterized protein JWM62_2856 [Frankiales bacterium]|nr:uncharacterized protein [Frankiales bacterium]
MHRLLVAVVLLLTGCSAGSDPDTATPPAPSVPSSSAPAAPSPSPTPTARTIDVTYAAGEISGVEGRVEVEKGEQLVLRFTSDVVEEIHVHGYDLYADLVPGQPAQIAFTADLPGSYEVELHEAGRPLFQLRVS